MTYDVGHMRDQGTLATQSNDLHHCQCLAASVSQTLSDTNCPLNPSERKDEI